MSENIITITPEDDGQRLDRWLKKRFPGIPFGQMQKILRTGQLRVDGKRVKGEARLAAGQNLRLPPLLTLPAAQKALSPKPAKAKKITDADIDFVREMVIYKDDHIIAINKPSGLAVQGGSKVREHVDGLLDGLTFEKEKRPHLVHRLDRDTSGLLLLARDARTAKDLGELFRSRDIRKYYWAITVPAPEINQGKIQSSLAKVAGRGGERMMAVGRDDGKFALTYYSVLENLAKTLALVAFWPRTGRTHQIRVHAAQMGCPILGDYKYGGGGTQENAPEVPDILHLHARRIIFSHPVTGRDVDITAPLSPEMARTFELFGFDAWDSTDPFEDIE